ncbi:MAG: M20 family metallopeptidase, partial [Deltaproteobacteria bacterium]|nr:M20 family metallopeptidase [Deltaproteobacteria bacterium]
MNDKFEDIAVKELETMVALARTSGASNGPILDHLQGLYEGLGWQARRLPLNDGGEPRANLVIKNSDSPGVMFDVHTDTVPPGSIERWTETDHEPRKLTRKGDRLYGLGSSDTLASGAVLNTLAMQGRLPEGTAIVYTADEEVGAIGATHLLADGG